MKVKSVHIDLYNITPVKTSMVMTFNYRPQRSWGKVMFLQASVILLTRVGCTLPGTPPGTRYTPRDKVHPPGTGTPLQTRYTPLDQVHPPWDQVYPPQDQVHPPDQVHLPHPPGPGRYGLRAGGTHPTGMHSCF